VSSHPPGRSVVGRTRARGARGRCSNRSSDGVLTIAELRVAIATNAFERADGRRRRGERDVDGSVGEWI